MCGGGTGSRRSSGTAPAAAPAASSMRARAGNEATARRIQSELAKRGVNSTLSVEGKRTKSFTVHAVATERQMNDAQDAAEGIKR